MKIIVYLNTVADSTSYKHERPIADYAINQVADKLNKGISGGVIEMNGKTIGSFHAEETALVK